MSGKIRILLTIALLTLLALTGCSAAVQRATNEEIGSTEIERTLQYVAGQDVGPAYTVTLSVPSDWVGNFRTRTTGSQIHFDYVAGNRVAPIFSIEALSRNQYWETSGSYPAYYTNLANKFETLFAYHLPIDPYYSGLPADEYAAIAAQVADIVATFNATPAATQ